MRKKVNREQGQVDSETLILGGRRLTLTTQPRERHRPRTGPHVTSDLTGLFDGAMG
jgi:hypothetical protein